MSVSELFTAPIPAALVTTLLAAPVLTWLDRIPPRPVDPGSTEPGPGPAVVAG
jgi:hypothetical protein